MTLVGGVEGSSAAGPASGRRIVDTFPFSEPHEVDLLLLKLRLEAPVVDAWVIVENSWSFQGEDKGLFADALIAGDDRFSPYRDRISVVTAQRPVIRFDEPELAELAAFEVERWQRDLATERIRELARQEGWDPSSTWVLITDVDEMLDGTDPSRVEALGRLLGEGGGVVRIPTRRYWFDFDNQFAPLMGIPIVQLADLDSEERSLGEVRRAGSGLLTTSTEQVVAFEYTSCYPAESIFRKLSTQSHTGYSRADLDDALSCNHRPIASARGMRLRDSDLDLLERVELDAANSPAHVREHLAELRTGNVRAGYRERRARAHPWLGTRRNRVRARMGEIRSQLRRKAIYAVRRAGWRQFGRSAPAEPPSPWRDRRHPP